METYKSPKRLLDGILSLRWGTYRITTTKNLRVGDEVMVARFPNSEQVHAVTPSEAKRMTDEQRMLNDVTVLTVAKVERVRLYGSDNAKRIHLHGESRTLDVARTSPCLVRIVLKQNA